MSPPPRQARPEPRPRVGLQQKGNSLPFSTQQIKRGILSPFSTQQSCAEPHPPARFRSAARSARGRRGDTSRQLDELSAGRVGPDSVADFAQDLLDVLAQRTGTEAVTAAAVRAISLPTMSAVRRSLTKVQTAAQEADGAD